MIADTQIAGQSLKVQAISLTLIPDQVWMGCAEYDVRKIWKLFQNRRNGTKHLLDPLIRREQAKCQPHHTASHVELILILVGIHERDIGDTVCDHVDF